MADVFISYAREDREAIEGLARLLEGAGLSCWWDRQLTAGTRFLERTEVELKAAKAVLVVWTRHSIGSHWVADEAGLGRDEGKLAPISLDGSPPPLGFRQFQVIDFTGWKGETDHRFRELVSALAAFVQAAEAKNGTPDLSNTGHPPERTHTEGAAANVLAQMLPRRSLLIAAAGGLVAAGGIGWLALSPRETTKATHFRSVAVLPFEDRSPDGEQAFLAEGLAESLLDRLAKNQDLRVPARTSSFAFRGKGITAIEIARELNVETVLEGSIMRDGDIVRIRAALSEASSGRQIWSETYERDRSQIESMFELQDEITSAIVRELQATIGASSVKAQARPANREAWEAFLEGNTLMGRGNLESAKLAEAAFSRAIEADPNFGPAYARLALAILRSSTSDDALLKARDHIAKAFELDPDMPDAIIAEALAASSRPPASPTRLERLVAEDPGNIQAQSLLVVLLVMRGRLRDAEAPMRAIRELDPFGGDSVNGAIWLLEMTGRADQAVKLTERALRLNPEDRRLHEGRIVEYAYLNNFLGFIRAAVEALEAVPKEFEVRYLAKYAFAWANLEFEALSIASTGREQLESWVALTQPKTLIPILPDAGRLQTGNDLAIYSTLVTTEPGVRLSAWEAYHRDFPFVQTYFLGPRGHRVFVLAARRDAGDREGASAMEREIRDFHQQMDAEGWSGLVADNQKLCFAAALDDRETVWKRWDAMFSKGAWYLPEPYLTLFDPMRSDPKFQERVRRYEAERAKAKAQVEQEGLLERARKIIARQGWSADPKPF